MKDNTVQYNLRITKSTGIPSALDEMQDETGISKTMYMRDAIASKLVHDGYLSSMPKLDLRKGARHKTK